MLHHPNRRNVRGDVRAGHASAFPTVVACRESVAFPDNIDKPETAAARIE
jgi:hypothetical protein